MHGLVVHEQYSCNLSSLCSRRIFISGTVIINFYQCPPYSGQIHILELSRSFKWEALNKLFSLVYIIFTNILINSFSPLDL